jgi:hypothetical protein
LIQGATEGIGRVQAMFKHNQTVESEFVEVAVYHELKSIAPVANYSDLMSVNQLG